VWPDGGGRGENVDRWPNAEARARVKEVFQRLTTLEPVALGAEELTPEELPFLRFDAAAQECFDAWRRAVEQRLRAEDEHPVWRSPVHGPGRVPERVDGPDGAPGGAGRA
jgi:hypothetical protein